MWLVASMWDFGVGDNTTVFLRDAWPYRASELPCEGPSEFSTIFYSNLKFANYKNLIAVS